MVLAGERLRESKKKAKMASATSSSQRDWGKVRRVLPTRPRLFPACQSSRCCSLCLRLGQGMACVGRTKECTIVPSNHYGPIPGIPVGTMWRFRVQVPAASRGSRGHAGSSCFSGGSFLLASASQGSRWLPGPSGVLSGRRGVWNVCRFGFTPYFTRDLKSILGGGGWCSSAWRHVRSFPKLLSQGRGGSC